MWSRQNCIRANICTRPWQQGLEYQSQEQPFPLDCSTLFPRMKELLTLVVCHLQLKLQRYYDGVA